MDRRRFVRLTASTAALAGVSPAWSVDAFAQPEGFRFYSPVAEAWFRGGQYFPWTSTTAYNNGRTVQVFHRTFGDRGKPALVLVHGYPTSSFDFREMIELLADDYFIGVLDFPGFGFSDKPQDGYSYMLEDDARLLDHFVDRILGLDRFHLYTHDRGVSVGLAFLGNYLRNANRRYEITYHFMSNSGMFLPLATLSEGQTVLLSAERGPQAIAQQKAQPRRTEGSPEQLANADIQEFNDGIGARLGVGKYLLERAANETRWLENLPPSPVPVALLWGLLDPVNPVRIANHVWQTYLNDRDAQSSLWYLPTAAHYPQRDKPAEVARVVRLCLEGQVPALEGEEAFMRTYPRTMTADSPIFVGRSRVRPMEFPGAVPYSPSGYRY